MISEEQIRLFFQKQCTAEEAEQVAAWLKGNPHIASQYLDELEWQEAADSNKNIPTETYVDIWQGIHRNIRKQKGLRLLKHSAVAACIGGCLIAGLFYLHTNTPALPGTIAKNKTKVAMPVSLTDTEYNYSTRPRKILLKDGSVMTLSPRSVAWFDTPFARTNRRDIHLQGTARFEVAKNKEKPFTVYAGAFTTTALGTEFIVRQQHHTINVQLMHGKVVIKTTDNSIKNWQNIYLLPGQQMVYHESDATANVSLMESKKTSQGNGLPVKMKTEYETADSLIFTGSDMSAVFQKLESYYQVSIQFTASDLKNISFTGMIAKKDSVDNILRIITQMNGLTVEQTDSGFAISKDKN